MPTPPDPHPRFLVAMSWETARPQASIGSADVPLGVRVGKDKSWWVILQNRHSNIFFSDRRK
jgi:hypothetical protein